MLPRMQSSVPTLCSGGMRSSYAYIFLHPRATHMQLICILSRSPTPIPLLRADRFNPIAVPIIIANSIEYDLLEELETEPFVWRKVEPEEVRIERGGEDGAVGGELHTKVLSLSLSLLLTLALSRARALFRCHPTV